MSILPELLAANERYAATFESGRLPRPPSRKIAVITCLDGRIDAHAILGLHPGEANVIRNAGGRAADAIRSLAVSQHLLGTREVVIMFHTDCGQAAFGTDGFRRRVTEQLGPAAGQAAQSLDFLPITDLEQALRDDVAMVRTHPLLRHDIPVTGLIYDVETGRVTEVN
jgi:carbonic anhydrase